MADSPIPGPHPDFDSMGVEEIRDHLRELEEDISIATRNGADQLTKTWLFQERNLAQTALKRHSSPINGNGTGPAQQVFWPSLITSAQLLDLPPDPTRWVWDQCLPLRSTSALIAREYTGKSTFAISLSLAVARGIEFLGRPTQQGNVAYVYLDGPLDEVKENSIKVGLTRSDNILFYGGPKPDLVIEWVKIKCKEHQIKLLIIDTAQKFFGFKEDKYEEKINKMQPMLDLVQEFNFHAMFTYHAAKNSANTVSALGSVASEANARVSLYLRRLSETNQRVFETQQNTGKRFDSIGLSDPNEGFITKTGSLFEIEIKLKKVEVLQAIKDNPGMIEVDIKNEVGGKGRIIGMAIRQLVDEGEVERTGTGKKGDARKHWPAGTMFKTDDEKTAKIVDLFRKPKGEV